MMGFFYLATLYGSLRYWGATSGTHRTAWLLLTTMACFLGMACKEVMVSAPLVVLLYDRTFRSHCVRGAWRQAWPLYLALAAGWGVLIYLNCQLPRSATAGFSHGIAPYVWWFTQAKVLWMYLKLVFWPCPLTIHYGTAYLTNFAEAWPWLLATTVLVATTLVLLCCRAAGFVGISVLAILSPTLVVPIITEVAAERRMYLPSAGLIALVVAVGYCTVRQVGEHLVSNSPAMRLNRWCLGVTVGVATVLAIMLSMESIDRLTVYSDDLKLWEDAAKSQPNDSIIHNNLGIALANAGRLEEAIDNFKIAVQIKPDNVEAYNNLGAAFQRTGQIQEAIEQFRLSVEINPDFVGAQNNLGKLLLISGQFQDAILHFKRAIRLSPGLADVHWRVGRCSTGNRPTTGSTRQFRGGRAERNPNMRPHGRTWRTAYVQLNRPIEAINAAQKALELAQMQKNLVLVQQVKAWLIAHGVNPKKSLPAR